MNTVVPLAHLGGRTTLLLRIGLSLFLLATAVGYQLSTRALLDLPWPLLVGATGMTVALLWPVLKRLGHLLGWILAGLMVAGILAAGPEARADLFLGSLLLLGALWGLSRFLRSLLDAFLTGYRGNTERTQHTMAAGSQAGRFEVIRGRASHNAWDEVIVPHEVKHELQVIQGVLRDYSGLQREWGQAPPLGMLLYGPPGTGKTLIARTLAHTSGYAFIAVSASDILDAPVGSSEKAVRVLFEQARAEAPCIVFIDEIDTLAARRSATGMDWGGAVRGYNNTTGQLLQEIDGFRQHARPVFTIGATNRLDVLDEALRSRLSYHVYIGLPDQEARQRLFALYTRSYRHHLACSVEWLARESADLSGRDIHEVCRWVAIYAHSMGMDEVHCGLFVQVFKRLKKKWTSF